MIDLALLQSVSYIAGALGVCVAAIYYILNLGEVILNRRISFTTNFILPISSNEGMMHYISLTEMRWTDMDDYMKKYDSSVNPDNFVARNTYWTTCEVLGFQYKRGLIDLETVYEMCGEYIIDVWLKFKPIIEEYKRLGQYGKDTFHNFEYLAIQLAKIKQRKDPTYPPIQKFFNKNKSILINK
jgi:hypothetical protein